MSESTARYIPGRSAVNREGRDPGGGFGYPGAGTGSPGVGVEGVLCADPISSLLADVKRGDIANYRDLLARMK
jgi:hypothetical protein